MRYGGNDLACQNCHLNAGLQPFAAPFVSTFGTFPTRRPCKQTRQFAAGIEDQENHAKRAIELDADQRLLRHGANDAADERRPPDEQCAE
jgi:cytochrome c